MESWRVDVVSHREIHLEGGSSGEGSCLKKNSLWSGEVGQ